MNDETLPVVIVLADDDPDDVMLAREALEESRLLNDFRSVSDGAELLDYLRQEGAFTAASAPRPDLVLLDLNMPRMGGLEALRAIKEDPSLRGLPIVVLTTSDAEEDIEHIWRAASGDDRPNITAAIYDIRDALQSQPQSVGESRSGSRRVAFRWPLVVSFDVDVVRGIVWIASVGRLRSGGTDEPS